MSPISKQPEGDPRESTESPNVAFARWAIWLAVVLGVSPVGHDFLFAAASAESAVPFILLAGLFLLAMVTPLAMLFRQSGWNGFWSSPIRITFACLIIGLNLCFYGFAISRHF